LGILVEAIQSLGYIADIERKIKLAKPCKGKGKGTMRQFKPDITVVNKKDKIVGIIEYETIDASGPHLFRKIKYFGNCMGANEDLEFVVYFPTLTTLRKAPAEWIKKNRHEYIRPILGRMKKLSEYNSNIKCYFLYLDKHGISSSLIIDGKFITKGKRDNIFQNPTLVRSRRKE